jgi:hypothetical protein
MKNKKINKFLKCQQCNTNTQFLGVKENRHYKYICLNCFNQFENINFYIKSFNLLCEKRIDDGKRKI